MDIEVQNMYLKHAKISFKAQKMTSGSVFKTKMTFKNVLEYSRIIPAQFPYIKQLFSMKIDENQQKSKKIESKYNIPHFYPFWGALSH